MSDWAPASLRAQLGKTPKQRAPDKSLSASQIDPFKAPRALSVLKHLRKICLSYPEAGEGSQFGHPVWLAGRKTFAIARHAAGRLTLCFWVGVDAQGLLTADPRFEIPPYFGHNGWIALDVSKSSDWAGLLPTYATIPHMVNGPWRARRRAGNAMNRPEGGENAG